VAEKPHDVAVICSSLTCTNLWPHHAVFSAIASTALVQLRWNVDAFSFCSILKLTEKSVAIIPNMLIYFFVAISLLIMDEQSTP